MKTIKLPICKKSICGVEIEKASEKAGIEIDEENKIVKIHITDNPTPDVSIVKISIAESGSLFCEEDWLWWEREVERVDTFTEEPILERFPTIFIQNPEMCFWKFTQLSIYGTDRCGYIRDPSHGCMYHRYDAGYDGIGEFGYVFSQQVPQNAIVPGQELVLYIGLHNGSVYEVDNEWWCTCCFTGGQVVEVIGEHGTIDVRYIVRIEGEEVYCVSTDFVEYAVGDWVFITKNKDPEGGAEDGCSKETGNCGNIHRTDSCKEGCNDTGEEEQESVFLKITELINKARVKAGVAPVTVNKLLNRSASAHTKDMADKCFVNLIGSDGKDSEQRVRRGGYVTEEEIDDTFYVEEIVDFSEITIEDLFKDWLDNPTRYDIITNKDAKEIGLSETKNTKCDEINSYYEGLLHPQPDSGKFYSLVMSRKKAKEKEELTMSEFAYMILPLKVWQDGA